MIKEINVKVLLTDDVIDSISSELNKIIMQQKAEIEVLKAKNKSLYEQLYKQNELLLKRLDDK